MPLEQITRDSENVGRSVEAGYRQWFITREEGLRKFFSHRCEVT